jgi:hypothetical protein
VTLPQGTPPSDGVTDASTAVFEPVLAPVEPLLVAPPSGLALVAEEPEPVVPVADEPEPVVAPVADDPEPVAVLVADEPDPVAAPVADEPEPVADPVAPLAALVEPPIPPPVIPVPALAVPAVPVPSCCMESALDPSLEPHATMHSAHPINHGVRRHAARPSGCFARSAKLFSFVRIIASYAPIGHRPVVASTGVQVNGRGAASCETVPTGGWQHKSPSAQRL